MASAKKDALRILAERLAIDARCGPLETAVQQIETELRSRDAKVYELIAAFRQEFQREPE